VKWEHVFYRVEKTEDHNARVRKNTESVLNKNQRGNRKKNVNAIHIRTRKERAYVLQCS
jgi:hypothetical protein